jgi:hypothetical protein
VLALWLELSVLSNQIRFHDLRAASNPSFAFPSALSATTTHMRFSSLLAASTFTTQGTLPSQEAGLTSAEIAKRRVGPLSVWPCEPDASPQKEENKIVL